MRSATSKLKRRRTSLSEAGQTSTEGCALQRVPGQRKRHHLPRGSDPTTRLLPHKPGRMAGQSDEKREEEEEEEEEGALATKREVPSLLLTTPEGVHVAAHDPGRAHTADRSDAEEEAWEWDTAGEGDDEDEGMPSPPPPLLWEPPTTPTEKQHPRGPPPLVPARPTARSRSLAFMLTPLRTRTRAADAHEAFLLSPLAVAAAAADSADGDEPTTSSWSWSSSSSTDSDDSNTNSDSSDDDDDDSDDDDSDDDESLNARLYRHSHGRVPTAEASGGKGTTPLFMATDAALVSFPALLSPEMQSFLGELDPEDVRDAEELLWVDAEDDDDGDDDDAQKEESSGGCVRAVEDAGDGGRRNAFARPLPRWMWLRSSESLPVFREDAGPANLRHGASGLRMAESVGGS